MFLNNKVFNDVDILEIFIETHNRAVKLKWIEDIIDKVDNTVSPNSLLEEGSIEANLYNNQKEDEYFGLVWPINQKKNNTRYSEQEIRQLCIEVINFHKCLYSIENPTKNNYIFNSDIAKYTFSDINEKKTGINVRTDLSIYLKEIEKKDKNNRSNYKQLRIEFKAGIVELKNIAKDFLKLLAEEDDGVYFHSISPPKEKIFQVLNSQINQFSIAIQCLKDNNYVFPNLKKDLYFFVSCIKPNFLIYKKIPKKDIFDNGIINMEYTFENNEFRFVDANSWTQLVEYPISINNIPLQS